MTMNAISAATSGMQAARTRSDNVAHNVANVATPGYTRRLVQLSPAFPNGVPAIFSVATGAGTGVQLDGIIRAQDQFLENRVIRESGIAGAANQSVSLGTRIEAVFGEPSDVGIASELGEFWSSWDDLANNPSSSATRSAVLASASTLTSALSRAASELTELRGGVVSEIGGTVSDINLLAEQIASLNGGIGRQSASGMPAADLEDQRDQLIKQLAGLVDVAVQPTENGSVTVIVGGRALVSGANVEKMRVTQSVAAPGTDLDAVGWTQTQVVWDIDGVDANVTSGRLAANLTAANSTIPAQLVALDGVAASLVGQVNAVHATGYNEAGVTGTNFFDAAGVRASTISLDAALAGNPAGIAASSASGSVDGDIAGDIAELMNAAGGPDEGYQVLIGNLAARVGADRRLATTSSQVLFTAEMAREAVSGVDIDEEMTELMLANQAFAASARVISTVDEMMRSLLSM